MLRKKGKIVQLLLMGAAVFLSSKSEYCSTKKVVSRNIAQQHPIRVALHGLQDDAENFISITGSYPVSEDLNYNLEQGFQAALLSKFSKNTDDNIELQGYIHVDFGLDADEEAYVQPGAVVFDNSCGDPAYYVIGSSTPYTDSQGAAVQSNLVIAKIDQDTFVQDTSYNGGSGILKFPDTSKDALFSDSTYYVIKAAKLAGKKLYFAGTIRDYNLDSDVAWRSFLACYNIEDCVWIIKPQIIKPETAGNHIELMNIVLDVDTTCNGSSSPDYLYACGYEGTQGIIQKYLIKTGMFELQNSDNTGVTDKTAFTATGTFKDQGTVNSCIWDMQLTTDNNVDDDTSESYIVAIASELESTIHYLQTVTIHKIKASNGQSYDKFGQKQITRCGVTCTGYQKYYFDEFTLQYPASLRLKDSPWIKNIMRHSVHITEDGDIFGIGHFANYVSPFVYKLNTSGQEKPFKNVLRYTVDENFEPQAIIDASPLYYPLQSKEWGSEMETYILPVFSSNVEMYAIGTKARAYRYEGESKIHKNNANKEAGELGVFEVTDGEDVVRKVDLSRDVSTNLELGGSNNGIVLYGTCHYDSGRSIITFEGFDLPEFEIEDISDITLQLNDGAQHHSFSQENNIAQVTLNTVINFTVDEQNSNEVYLSGVVKLHFNRRRVVHVEPIVLKGIGENSSVSLTIETININNIFNKVTHNQNTLMDHFNDLLFIDS